jgi:iron-sulfur cluster repair protein YtfE (RIC family)
MVINNRHEDEILFPYILQIEKLYEKEEEYGQLFVRTLRKPLNILEKGNLAINELINEVETLTDNYTCSKKASLAMKVLYKQMKEMQDIFTQQKYLENAILFPKAMEIENIVLKEKYNN